MKFKVIMLRLEFICQRTNARKISKLEWQWTLHGCRRGDSRLMEGRLEKGHAARSGQHRAGRICVPRG